MENAVFAVVAVVGQVVVTVVGHAVADVGSSVVAAAAAQFAAAVVVVVVLVEVEEVPVMDRRSLAASFHPGMLLGMLLLLGTPRRSGGLDVEDVLLLLSMPRQLWHQQQQPASWEMSMQVRARRLNVVDVVMRLQDAEGRVLP